jgi:hypothetical protein
MIDKNQFRKAARKEQHRGKNRACGEQLGSGEQIKAKGVGKGGWQTVESDRQGGSIRWTGIAGQALLPGETPMRALCAREDPSNS